MSQNESFNSEIMSDEVSALQLKVKEIEFWTVMKESLYLNYQEQTEDQILASFKKLF